MAYDQAAADWQDRAQVAEAKIEAVRMLAESWPDGNEQASDYAAARGQCKRAVLTALAVPAGTAQPDEEQR